MSIYETLKKLNIEYKEIEHNPVFTVEEGLKEAISKKIEGAECKNLFLKDTKNNYYLVLTKSNKKVDLKKLSNLLNIKRLSFANEIELNNILQLEKGSVTPLGIINDVNNKVLLLLDSGIKKNKVLIHPNINNKTVSIKYSALIKFIEYCNHKYIIF